MRNRRAYKAAFTALVLASVPTLAAANGGAALILFPIAVLKVPAHDGTAAALSARLVPIAAPSAAHDRIGWLMARTRVRYARAMADFYPVQYVGVHLSGGTRFNAGYDPSTASPDTEIAMTLDPRRPSGAIALRDGFERFAPVAMAGYSQQIGKHCSAGVDAGAMLGRAVTLYPFIDRPIAATGPRRDSRSVLNPAMDVTLSFSF